MNFMDNRTFEAFRRLIYEKSGIAISEKKETLLVNRIGKRMRALDITDPCSYLRFVRNDQKETELIELLNAVSTNVTRFYREPQHFGFLTNTIQHRLCIGQRKFRIWCAACSTGEEPYTAAITILDAARGYECDIRILATDINTHVLCGANKGEYTQERLYDVPPQIRNMYFNRKKSNGISLYTICENVRKMVSFSRLNLSETPFPMHGPFDVIFIRNVMIYFDNDVRRRLISEAYRLLSDKGYLIVGHAESLTGMLSGFKSVQPSVYSKGLPYTEKQTNNKSQGALYNEIACC